MEGMERAPPGLFVLQNMSGASRALAGGQPAPEAAELDLEDVTAFIGELAAAAAAISESGPPASVPAVPSLALGTAVKVPFGMLPQDTPRGRRTLMPVARRSVLLQQKDAPKEAQMDAMLDDVDAALEASGNGTAEVAEFAPLSVVKQRCAELEILQPFCEARDLIRASLQDKKDRDRRKLKALVGDNGGGTARIERARKASQKIMKSQVKIPANVLLEFLAACDSCEQVLTDREDATNDCKRAQWLVSMRSAAEQYLERMKLAQRKQSELEDEWFKANAVRHDEPDKAEAVQEAPHPLDLPELTVEFSSLFDFLHEYRAEDDGVALLSTFIGEYPPSLSETFSSARRDSMLGRLLQCVAQP